MVQDLPAPRRQTLRLKGYDYASAGAYFVTICAHERVCLFGKVAVEEMVPNNLGEVVIACWQDLPSHFPHVELDAFSLMPNHVHGIIILREDEDRVGLSPAPTTIEPSSGDSPWVVVGAFKSFSSRRINLLRQFPGALVWQRGYHDHDFCNETSLLELREYVAGNPLRWQLDELYPGALF